MANRSALQWCIHQMVATPELAVEARGFLERRASGEKVDEDANWCSSYKQVARLPAYWMARWIQSASSNTINIGLLEALEEKETNAVRHLFYFFTGKSDTSYLPRQFLNKAVCWSAFMKRHERLGSPAHNARPPAFARTTRLSGSDMDHTSSTATQCLESCSLSPIARSARWTSLPTS